MRKLCLFLFAALLGISAGCAPSAVSELYSLPQMPDEYLSLQQLIDAEIAGGSQYASPLRGSNSRSVQLHDLNSSGQYEALAFFRTREGMPKICIYSSADGVYSPVCTITGEGSNIGRVEFADMDGDGICELIVAWQMGDDISMLCAYSLENWSGSTLLTTDCSGFCIGQLDGQNSTDLMVLRYDNDHLGYIDLYTLSSGAEMNVSTAQLSRGFEDVRRMTIGSIEGNTPALFVEGAYMDSRTITDVMVCENGQLYNILAKLTGISGTMRSYAVYSQDIDGDGLTELPGTRRLTALDDAEHRAFDWKSVGTGGDLSGKMSTYHCYSDGWYLDLEIFSDMELAVRREDSTIGKCLIFSSLEDDVAHDIVSVFTFTGASRDEYARSGGRELITAHSNTSYAVYRHTDDISLDDMISHFHLIRSEWISPVL